MAILKSLTIDGIENVIHDPVIRTGSKTINVPANAWTTGATMQVQGKGVYGIRCSTTLPTGAATGNTVRRIRAMVDATEAMRLEFMNANNYGATYTLASLFTITDNNPHTVTVDVFSSQVANNTGTTLTLNKFIDLGGVIRHLKSVAISMLNRPLNIGKAVA